MVFRNRGFEMDSERGYLNAIIFIRSESEHNIKVSDKEKLFDRLEVML